MAADPREFYHVNYEDYYELYEDILLDKFGNTIEIKTYRFHESASATKTSCYGEPVEASSGFQVGYLCQDIKIVIFVEEGLSLTCWS